MTLVDLVLDNGELVCIACPDKHADELHAALLNAMSRKTTWSPLMFEKCRAEYLGLNLETVNMARVIGTL